jgi:hypothetical protein
MESCEGRSIKVGDGSRMILINRSSLSWKFLLMWYGRRVSSMKRGDSF